MGMSCMGLLECIRHPQASSKSKFLSRLRHGRGEGDGTHVGVKRVSVGGLCVKRVGVGGLSVKRGSVGGLGAAGVVIEEGGIGREERGCERKICHKL